MQRLEGGSPGAALLIMALLLAVSAGCVSEDGGSTAGTIPVVVTIPPQAEFVERVGGDRVEVMVMVPPGASPHTHEPTPGQLSQVSRAEMYAMIGSGIGFERVWMARIGELNPGMLVVDCSEGVALIEAGDGHAADPHIWLSPKNAAIMVENIYRGLALVDPDHAGYYRQNADRYLEELRELDAEIEQALGTMENRKILVYHPSWGYLARDYDLEQIPIEHDGKEPTPQGLEHLIRQAKEDNITVVFASPEFSTRSAEVVAAEIGGEVVMVSPLARDYLENMKSVADAFSRSASA
ncbi:MAG: zinc ABC transporter substrate-binding protein [Methanomicrobiaceae archaeon]|nr:zinc ABC transporter substrate-binding protein [Methanomicrobiaceae archaeon]